MNKSLFKDYSGNSTIWIYGFDKELSDREVTIVRDYFDNFVQSWKSHGDVVTGTYELLFDRFLILCAKTSGVSGCSIDSSVSIFKELRDKHVLNALDQDLIFYRESLEINSVRRIGFEELVREGKITLDTPVFDTTIQNLEQLQEGKFEIPLRDSWHMDLIRKVA